MINPAAVMKLLNERGKFQQNHPEVSPFVRKWFGKGVEPGTVIEIRIVSPDGETPESVKIEIADSEMGFFAALKQLLVGM